MNRPNFETLLSQPRVWTKREVSNLYFLLKNMKGVRGIPFLKKTGLLLEELRPIGEALTLNKCVPSLEAYHKYETGIAELQRKHNIVNDKDILDNATYQKELRELNAVNRKMVSEYYEDLKAYNDMMLEPFTERKIEWQYFEDSILPENISSELYFALLPLMQKAERKED